MKRKYPKQSECSKEGCTNRAGHMMKTLCRVHYYENRDKKSWKGFKRVTRKKNAELDNFFKSAIEKGVLHPYSFESGSPITKVGRVNIAHIMPKGVFPSIGSHSRNYILLTWDEHSLFDSLLDLRRYEEIAKQLPKCWARMKEVLPQLLEACTETNKKQYQYFQDILDCEF